MYQNKDGLQNKIPSSLENWSEYIRWFFNAFVISFLAIVISGKMLFEIPVLRLYSLRGIQKIHFLTGVVNIVSFGTEVIVGLAGFFSILLFSGLLIGPVVPNLMLSNFGINVTHFESLCIFSALLLSTTSFIVKILYSSFFYTPVVAVPIDYEEQIEKLTKEIGDNKNE